jgi:hypothetical protein
MALRRLGLAYDFIGYLLEFDRRNEHRVRTYYGDSESFAFERGTCPQGGVESCYMHSLLSWAGCSRWLSAVVMSPWYIV